MERIRIVAIWQDGHDRGAGVAYFDDAGEGNPVERARQAIEDYVRSPEARPYLEELAPSCFNWGDAFIEIPAEHWRQYGLTPVPQPFAHTYEVDHDETFGEDVTAAGQDEPEGF